MLRCEEDEGVGPDGAEPFIVAETGDAAGEDVDAEAGEDWVDC